MNKTTRALATLAAGTLAAGGMIIGTATAASASPECVGGGGISRTVGADGVTVYQNDPRCGAVYHYDQQYEVPVGEPYTLDPVIVTGLPDLPWGCEGVVASVICDNWGNPERIEVDGNLIPNPEYVPAEEEAPEGNVDVGEPEPMAVDDAGPVGGGGGGFGGGGYGGGGFVGGFGGSGGSGGGTPTVTVGEYETVAE